MLLGAAELLRWTDRPVCRQIDPARRVGELCFPIGKLSLQYFALKPIPLPHREIRVLNRQFRQRRRPARYAGLVERRDLAEENILRPPIGDDVVHRVEYDVVVFSQPDHPDAEQRSNDHIEGQFSAFNTEPLDFIFAIGLRQLGKIRHREINRLRGRDQLNGNPVDCRKRRTQRLVPFDDLIYGITKRNHIQRTREARHIGHDVGPCRGMHLVSYPQALLSEGEGDVAFSRHAGDRSGLRARRDLHRFFDRVSHRRQEGIFE